MASGADDVLASAHVVPTLADALSGVRTAPTTVPPFSFTTREVSASSAWPKV